MNSKKIFVVSLTVVLSILLAPIVFAGGGAEPPVPQNTSPAKPALIGAQKYDFHTLGSNDAPVIIEVFGGLQEPYTHLLMPTLKQLMNNYPEKIKIVWHYYPLDFLTEEYWAGNAAECAADQGKFWEYQDDLFLHNSSEFGPLLYHRSAYQVGLDMKAFDTCVKTKRNMRRVEYDKQLGDKMGVFAVPTSFINGEKVTGAVPYAEFESIILKYVQD